MARDTRTQTRPEIIENAPMQYAPRNELGVVFLFSHVAKRLRLKVEQIRPGYPDCIAYQRTGRGDKKIRIEFEYKSRNFFSHGHVEKHCDWLVCWEHNWPKVPRRMRVVELRKMFGLGFNVWIMPVRSPYKEDLWALNSIDWSAPGLAADGDLILFYSTSPDSCIKDIFRITTSIRAEKQSWRRNVKGAGSGETDHFALMRRVCRLKAPIFLKDMRADSVLKTSHFVRAQMQGRPNASEYWPYLYDKIMRRNPGVAKYLRKYSPDALN